MIQFLANNIEQMDLALDQLALDNINYKRFALMLVDNAVEITLHRHAQDMSQQNEMWKPLCEAKHDEKAVAKALGQHFESKVKLARKTGLVDEDTATSIVILHSFRNQVFHTGLKYESILPALAQFYFRNACDVLEKYSPTFWSWTIGDKIPHRARKYLGKDPFMDLAKLYPQACRRLKEVAEGMPLDFVGDLSAHMQVVIDRTDSYLDFLANDSRPKRTRNQVVIDSQAWRFAFTVEGKAFANENNCQAKTVAEYVEWIASNYAWPIQKDPISGWMKRLEKLRVESDSHRALKRYKDFMDRTGGIREHVDQAAAQLDAHIEHQIDIARGK